MAIRHTAANLFLALLLLEGKPEVRRHVTDDGSGEDTEEGVRRDEAGRDAKQDR